MRGRKTTRHEREFTHPLAELLTRITMELLTERLEPKVVKAPPPQANASEKMYCLCQYNPNDETFIGCDSTSCKHEWFHLSCVKLKRVPKGSWYCLLCRKARKQKVSQHSQ
ncbi:uncharacterized protein LOC130613608 [Hydractinia symbiolongicarpus]|uniref:uncharacterized protein LOC130613608 n=1 Tax=Hydractinia symbiolongicarpus TaxID=13093 RepID=UPI00254ABE7B|nr:uncharacterized protein LOC130613608 [Hydractinia symbiolongicarpus]